MTSTKQIVASQNILRMTVEIDDPRLPQRFWDKVQIDSTVVVVAGKEYTGCWMWTAANKGNVSLDDEGNDYGAFGTGNLLGTGSAYRCSYENLVGPVPEGLELDHLCRRHPCVNPAHLEPVTRKVNMERGAEANRQFCPKGHEYTPENTRLYEHAPGLWARFCRACMFTWNHSVDPEIRAANNVARRVSNLTPKQHAARNANHRASVERHRDEINERARNKNAARRVQNELLEKMVA